MEQPCPNNDHDLLIELRTEMRGLREDVKEMSLTTGKVSDDHEDRLRKMERFIDKLKGEYAILAIAGSVLISVFTAWLLKAFI